MNTSDLGLDQVLVRAEQHLVVGLIRAWDPEEALVLADWCEEHGLDGAAWGLRHGPSAEARAVVDSLATCMGLAAPIARADWSDQWLGEQYEIVDSYTGEQIQAAPPFMRPYLLGSKSLRRRPARHAGHQIIIDFPWGELEPSDAADFEITPLQRGSHHTRVIAFAWTSGRVINESLRVVQIHAGDRSLLDRSLPLAALIDDTLFFARSPVTLGPLDDFIVHVRNDSPDLVDVRLQAVVQTLLPTTGDPT